MDDLDLLEGQELQQVQCPPQDIDCHQAQFQSKEIKIQQNIVVKQKKIETMKLTQNTIRTLINCVKQKATPNLNDAKADTSVARPSLKQRLNEQVECFKTSDWSIATDGSLILTFQLPKPNLDHLWDTSDVDVPRCERCCYRCFRSR